MLGKRTIIILCLLIISLLLGCSKPASAPSTAIQSELASVDELLSEINRLNSNITSYEYDREAIAIRLLERDVEFSTHVTGKMLLDKEKKLCMVETYQIDSAHSPDAPEETETQTRLQRGYIDGNSAYFGESVDGEPMDYVVEHNAIGALNSLDILEQQLDFLNSSEVTFLPDTDVLLGIECYVMELTVDMETLLNVMIIPSFWEVMTLSSQDISTLIPYVKDYSFKYWFSKDNMRLVKIYQYMELLSDEPDYSFNITYEQNHEFVNYNETQDINIPPEVSQTVIHDSLLAEGIREALGKEEGTITPQDLATLTELDAGHFGISSVAGLEHCINLEYLDISYHGDFPDLSPLSGLSKLETLRLSISGNTDLTPISNLVNLTFLEISSSDPVDISPILTLPNITELEIDWYASLDINKLEAFPKLDSLILQIDKDITDLTQLTNLEITRLSVGGRGITDISPSTQLDNLKSLTIYASNLSDISPLTQLPLLEYLRLEIHDDADFSPISELSSLKSLILSDHEIHDISFLGGLNKLESIHLARNNIIDITPLSGLTDLVDLVLYSNEITDLSPLSNLLKLEHLSISHMEISDITPLSGLTNLVDLELGNNEITDLSPLTALINLKRLLIYGNNIDDISVLANFPRLQELDLGNNDIVDISPLRNLHDLRDLYIGNNPVTDITPLVENPGLGEGDEVTLDDSRISPEIEENIKILESRDVTVNVW